MAASGAGLRAVVIDTGAASVKCGFAGADAPTGVFRSVVGTVVPAEDAGTAARASANARHAVGDGAFEAAGAGERLNVSYPLQGGAVASWDHVEQLWRHAFSTVLRAEPTEHPVLLTEPALNPPRNREEMTKIMFETFEVPSLFVAGSAVLTLYNGGRETGLVVSAGESFTDVVPIYESVVMTHAVQRLHVGGGALTARLRQQLLAGGVPASALAKPGAVQGIKETLCYCAADLDAELAAAKSGDAGKVSHKLPDGTVISVGQERFTCAEALFNPGLVGQDYADGLGAATSLAIRYCEPEMRKDMTGSIVVTGGTSMLRGFPARLTTEIQAHMAPKAAESVRVDARDDRRHGAWIGGSILAQLPLFDSMCVTSQEYEEQGPSIIHRKC